MSPVGFSVARYATWAKAVGLKGPCIGNEITPDLVFCRSQWGASVCFSCGSGTVAYARWHWSEPSSVFYLCVISFFVRQALCSSASQGARLFNNRVQYANYRESGGGRARTTPSRTCAHSSKGKVAIHLLLS